MNSLKRLPVVLALMVIQSAYAESSTEQSEDKARKQTVNHKEIEEITVLGRMFDAELHALALQRASDRIINVVSAEGIGKLPDRNVAEAVQRVAGVSIERDQGEGRFVAVRGLPSQWSSSSLNGHRLPSAEEETTSRATAFDFFPSELIERIEVTKALSADQEGDSIGGNVNFVTPTAPEYRTFDFSIFGGRADKAKGDIKSMSLLWGDRSEDGKFGYLVNVTGWNRDWATDNYEPRRNDVGIYRLELRDYTGERKTLGLNLGAEYNFDNGDKIFARSLYGALEDEELHYKHRLRVDKDRLELQNIHNTLITRMQGFEFGGEHGLSDTTKLNWSLATYENEFHYGALPNKKDRSYFVMRFDQKNVGYKNLFLDNKERTKNCESLTDEQKKQLGGSKCYIYNAIDVAGGDPANAIGSHLPDNFSMNPNQASLAWVELYKISVSEKDKIIASFDISKEISDDLTIKSGMKYRDKIRVSAFSDEFYQWNSELYGDAPLLSDFSLSDQPGRDDYLSEVDVDYQSLFTQVASMGELERFWNNNREKFELVEDESALIRNGAALGRNFKLAEQHLSAYSMATYRFKDRATLVAGLRLTQTQTRIDSQIYSVDESGEGFLAPHKADKGYLSVLPSAQLQYAITEDSNIRLALTRTFSRPDFGDLNPGGSYIEQDNKFSSGNADLEPTYAWNYDAIYEYYFNNTGMVSAGLFYKDITDTIFTNISHGNYNGRSAVEFFRPENGGDAWLRGFELNLVRKLDFLPGLFANIGVSANLTLMDSGMNIPQRQSEVSVPRQADRLHNIAVYYDDGAFSLRLAQNYKGDYIEEHGKDARSDNYYGAYTSLDIGASYKLNDRLAIFAEAVNLTNEPLTYYMGTQDRPKQVEYYGIRSQLGLSYSFY